MPDYTKEIIGVVGALVTIVGLLVRQLTKIQKINKQVLEDSTKEIIQVRKETSDQLIKLHTGTTDRYTKLAIDTNDILKDTKMSIAANTKVIESYASAADKLRDSITDTLIRATRPPEKSVIVQMPIKKRVVKKKKKKPINK